MLYLLILVPWVLTVAALLIIMVKRNESNEEYDDEGIPEIIRVAVYEDKAYWVYENVFYESEITREPDFATAHPINTMELAPKELDKLLAILDELDNEKE